jgi:hypothetical protein
MVVLCQHSAGTDSHGLQTLFDSNGRLGQFFKSELPLAKADDELKAAALVGATVAVLDTDIDLLEDGKQAG